MDRSRSTTSQALKQSESMTRCQPLKNKAEQPRKQRPSASAEEHFGNRRSMLPAPTLTSSAHPLPLSLISDGPPPYSQGISLADFGEQHGAEPSSYRKLRRSKSTATPRKNWRTAKTSKSQPIRHQANFLRHATSSVDFNNSRLKLKLKRSFDFVHTTSNHTVPHSPTNHLPSCNPQAIAMAREQFLQGPNYSSEGKGSPTFGTSRAGKKKLSFLSSRRSKQSGDSSPQRGAPAALSMKARSLSSTLRYTFKRLFSTPKSENTLFPPQQLQAAREHFGQPSSYEDTTNGFDKYCSAVSDHAARTIVHEASEYDYTTPCLPGDAGPLLSDLNCEIPPSATGSRVTSWTNSTHTSSLNEFELERKRLSVIREDGSPHQPSSSAGIHIGGISALRKLENVHQSPVPDSQRLYSALIRRIDEEDTTNKKLRNDVHTRPTIDMNQSQKTTKPYITDFDHGCVDREARPEEPASVMNPERLHDNLERRRERIRQQQMQSGFFPHSAQDKPDTISPFRRVLDARKGSQPSEDLDSSNVRATVAQEPQGLQSSDSVYSRTTHGGVNSEYEAFPNSDDDLESLGRGVNEAEGYAVILPRKRSSSLRKTNTGWPSFPNTTVASLDQTGPRVCTENETPNIDVSNTTPAHHIREDAQINETCESKGVLGQKPIRSKLPARLRLGRSFSENSARTSTDGGGDSQDLRVQKRRFPLLDVKQVNRNNTPAPNRSSSRSKSQFGVLQQVSKGEEDNHKPDLDFDKALTASFRKMSPTGIAKLVRSKRSMPVIKTHLDLGKENKYGTFASRANDTHKHTPLRVHNGNSTRELKKSQSHQTLPRHDVTEESQIKPIEQLLSARLSRPFDMITPIKNHASHSMHIGMHEPRLDTTAQLFTTQRSNTRVPYGYGGLGPAPFESRCDLLDDNTALPKIPSPNTVERKAGVKAGISISSKRMVSNFLKSRRRNARKEEEAVIPGQITPESDSPRFV